MKTQPPEYLTYEFKTPPRIVYSGGGDVDGWGFDFHFDIETDIGNLVCSMDKPGRIEAYAAVQIELPEGFVKRKGSGGFGNWRYGWCFDKRIVATLGAFFGNAEAPLGHTPERGEAIPLKTEAEADAWMAANRVPVFAVEARRFRNETAVIEDDGKTLRPLPRHLAEFVEYRRTR